jgi:hypothetical protein
LGADTVRKSSSFDMKRSKVEAWHESDDDCHNIWIRQVSDTLVLTKEYSGRSSYTDIQATRDTLDSENLSWKCKSRVTLFTQRQDPLEQTFRISFGSESSNRKKQKEKEDSSKRETWSQVL